MAWKKLKGVAGHVKGKIRLPIPPGWQRPSAAQIRLGADPYQGLEVDWATVVLEMSNLFKKSEEAIDGILVHEMIHLWMWTQKRPKESHGSNFMAKLAELQKKVQFKIPVTEALPKDVELTDTETVTPIGVAYGRKKNGAIIYMMISEKLARASAGAMYQEWLAEVTGDYPIFSEAKLVIAKNPIWTLHAAKRKIGRIAVKTNKPSKHGTKTVWPSRFVLPPDLAATLIPALADAEIIWSLP